MRLFHVAVLSLFALQGLACSASTPGGSNNDGASTDASTSSGFFTPKGITTTRAYFGTDNLLSIDASSSEAYALVDISAKSKVLIDASNADGSTTDVGFKLYRVTSTGKLTLVSQADGEKGDATHTLSTTVDSTYVIEVAASASPATIKLDLGCESASGHCTPKREVSETCGGIAGLACDTGLDCIYAPGTCKLPDAGGTCVLPTQFCSELYKAVCGCDGNTYPNACFATRAGTSVASQGACACDPTQFSVDPAPTASEVEGSWTSQTTTTSTIQTSNLTLGTDGTFTIGVYRAANCQSGHACPDYVALVGQATGTYKVTSNGVSLHAKTSQGTFPTSFNVDTNCAKTVELTTTIGGASETFAAQSN